MTVAGIPELVVKKIQTEYRISEPVFISESGGWTVDGAVRRRRFSTGILTDFKEKQRSMTASDAVQTPLWACEYRFLHRSMSFWMCSQKMGTARLMQYFKVTGEHDMSHCDP